LFAAASSFSSSARSRNATPCSFPFVGRPSQYLVDASDKGNDFFKKLGP
jgi:hypothetical protein